MSIDAGSTDHQVVVPRVLSLDPTSIMIDLQRAFCHTVFDSLDEAMATLRRYLPLCSRYVSLGGYCRVWATRWELDGEWYLSKRPLVVNVSYRIHSTGTVKDETLAKLSRRYLTFTNWEQVHTSIVFKPENHLSTPGELNLWGSGFRATEVEEVDMERVDWFLHHLRVVWAAGDEERYRYLISWFGQIVREPWKKTGTALIVHGVTGTGKSSLIHFVREHIIGSRMAGRTSSRTIQSITTCGVTWYTNLLVMVHGLPSGRLLRSVITDDTHQVRLAKGIDTKVTMQNTNNFIFTTNFSTKQPLTGVKDEDRRLFEEFELSECYVQDAEYTDTLVANMGHVNADHIFTYLKRM